MSARPAVRLGWRLAVRATGHGRVRSGLLVGATALGSFLLLGLLGIAGAVEADRATTTPQTPNNDLVLLAGAVLAVGLPVAVLSATVGRMSAALREQRLAQLHLMGMTRGQLAWVGVGEAAPLAILGWLVGTLALLGTLLLLPGGDVSIGGRSYTAAQLRPGWLPLLSVFLLVPGLMTAMTAWHPRAGGQRQLTVSRGTATGRVGWWRLAPLLIGLGLCWWARRLMPTLDGGADPRAWAMLGGVGLLGLGAVLAVPVLVRVLAAALIRVPRPAATVAARRLQAQPATLTRVLSALLIGLFLLTGARGVMVAFEDLSSYQLAKYHATVEASTSLSTQGEDPMELAAEVQALPWVRDAIPVRTMDAACEAVDASFCGGTAIIGTCSQLQRIAPGSTGCRDDRASWVRDGDHRAAVMTLHVPGEGPIPGEGLASEGGPTLSTALATVEVSDDVITVPPLLMDRLRADLFVPAGLPGVEEAARQGQAEVVVIADPSRDLFGQLERAGYVPTSSWDMGELDGIQRLIDGIRILSAVVLGIGLVAFGIGALDRGMERRRELVGLQLLGVPARLLTRCHWIEVGLPLVLGTVLALGLGHYAGSTYLIFAEEDHALQIPADYFWPLVVAALLGALLVAALTSIAASPRLTPDRIRTT